MAEGDKQVFDNSRNVTPPRDPEFYGRFVEHSVREMDIQEKDGVRRVEFTLEGNGVGFLEWHAEAFLAPIYANKTP